MLDFYYFTYFQILERHLYPPFKFNPFQLILDKTTLFVTLKRWKSLSVNQIIKFAAVITVTKGHSHAYLGHRHVKMIFKI